MEKCVGWHVGGRFLSIDPVEFVASGNDPAYFNRYAYVNNDPITYTDPTGKASKIARLVKLGSTAFEKGAKLSKQRAVEARRNGQNVIADTRQTAKQIEVAAHGTTDLIKHQKGHVLADGSKGKGHFQTKGKLGHTFWSIVAVTLASGAEVLNNVADASEILDPMTYLSSGEMYMAPNGEIVSYSELVENISNGVYDDDQSEPNSDNKDSGMSGENVRVCSGFGAQKDGC